MTNESSDVQEWEHWRNAGELLGRVRKGLGFGYVALDQDDSSFGLFRIQWSFNANGQRYSADYAFTDLDLSKFASIAIVAQSVVKQWKRDAREKLAGNCPQSLG